MLEVIDYHSVRTDILIGGPVLDIGCRDFKFSRTMASRGHPVVALDPDPEVTDPKIKDVAFLPYALVGKDPGTRELAIHPNPEARFIEPRLNISQYKTKSVKAVTILQLMEEIGVTWWDVVKINCEGEEQHILGNWPGTIARQIVVSFHEHFRPIGDEAIQKVMDHLGQWYIPVQHVKDSRYGGGMNFWDTVVAMKPILEGGEKA